MRDPPFRFQTERAHATSDSEPCQYLFPGQTIIFLCALLSATFCRTLDNQTGSDAPFSEPSLAHLQRVERRSLRPMRGLCLRGHVLDVENPAAGIQKGDRKR